MEAGQGGVIRGRGEVEGEVEVEAEVEIEVEDGGPGPIEGVRVGALTRHVELP